MTAKLTSEQILAMQSLPPGEPLVLVNDQSNKEYILFDKDVYERWVTVLVNAALDEADAGRDEPWDIESLKKECREELAKHSRNAS